MLDSNYTNTVKKLMHKPAIFALAILFLIASCKKDNEIIKDVIYVPVYEVDSVLLYTSSAQKTKQKTLSQFISILYADLFQSSIPSSELNDIGELYVSIGDKQLFTEMLTSNYMNISGVKIPSKTEMNNDIDQFITDTYVRFYLRMPTELERYYLDQQIQGDSDLTPELIFFSFALSNEYWYY